MKIYIDESGIFANPNNKDIAISCVGSLTIPDRLRKQVVKGYKRLLKKWGVTDYSEIKGSELDETKCKAVINMLARHEVMFSAVVVDTGYHNEDDIIKHKEIQGQKFISRITNGFNDDLITSLYDLCCELEKMSNPLYLQSVCMTQLVRNTFQNSTLYYSQVSPDTLGNFSWNIDAKSENITNYEAWWSSVVCPFLESKSLEKPLIQLIEGDYRAFQRFDKEDKKVPKRLEAHVVGDKDDFMASDISKIMKEDMNFTDSKKDYGLQLIDILTNCLGRSLRGNYQKEGWEALPQIMYTILGKKCAVNLMGLVDPPEGDKPYYACIRHLDKYAQSPF